MNAFGEERVAGFVEQLGERTPAPGGGAACAIAAALAAGLVEMAARFAGDAAAAERAGELREAAVPLADEDVRAYGQVLAAQGETRVAALAAAAGTPLRIAEAASEAAQIGARLVRDGKVALRGDALAGVLLAEAAARGAAELVAINLSAAPGDERALRAQAAAVQAARARSQALSAARPAGAARG